MDEALQFAADEKGPDGTLQIEPYFEAGELDDVLELDEVLDDLIPLRAEIRTVPQD